MKTTWRVTKIVATQGVTIAELKQVEWFKKNPAWANADEDSMVDIGDEYIDAEPGEEGAEFVDFGPGELRIDITDGLALSPGDNVAMMLDALTPVSR